MISNLATARTPLTLHRRFLAQNLLLVLGLIAAGALAVWRLGVVRGEVDLSHNVYAELRTVGDVGVEVGMVRGLLADPNANRQPIVTHLRYAIGGLDQFIQVGRGYGADDRDNPMREAYVPINNAAASARGRLQGVLDRLTSAAAPADDDAVSRADALRHETDLAMGDLDAVDASCVRFVSDRQHAAAGHLAVSLWLAGLLSVAAVVAAVLLSASQYRLVITPLRRLRQGVLRVADARFTETIDTSQMGRSAEFLEVAREFNRMARELDGFYRRLEEQVRARSRELVRSERLASVGFLAAGVAHEINNPLHIISGYAELTCKQLAASGATGDAARVNAEARQSLGIIREEAFRCKQVTERLLDLARGGTDTREPLDLAGVARDVAAMTRGLKRYQDRRVTLDVQAQQPLQVRANRSEMKQVLLNLTINALEAVPPERGEVRIEGHCGKEWVELSVADNGRGMTPEVLRHVFEPFFTTRRPNATSPEEDARGTGLGLSITHAIVESHGGRIVAESGGPGRGARFTVRLPTGPAAAAARLTRVESPCGGSHTIRSRRPEGGEPVEDQPCHIPTASSTDA